jgi:hypothetical protein
MMPLFITASAEIPTGELFIYMRFIAVFRIIRLYNLWTYINGRITHISDPL